MGAIGLQKAARQLETEGHLDFIKENMAGVPTVAQIKAGAAAFQLGGVDKFNAAGGGTIPNGAMGRAKVVKLADGQEVADFEVVDAGGKPLAPSARTIESMYQQTMGERQERGAATAAAPSPVASPAPSRLQPSPGG